MNECVCVYVRLFVRVCVRARAYLLYLLTFSTSPSSKYSLLAFRENPFSRTQNRKKLLSRLLSKYLSEIYWSNTFSMCLCTYIPIRTRYSVSFLLSITSKSTWSWAVCFSLIVASSLEMFWVHFHLLYVLATIFFKL